MGSCEKCGGEIKNYGIFLGSIRCRNHCDKYTEYKSKGIKIKTIDLNSRMYCVKLYSRLVLQELFNEYIKNGPMDKLDSILCDHYSLERFFTDYPEGWSFRWFHTGSLTDWETIEIPNFHESALIVSYKPETHSIEIIPEIILTDIDS